MTFVYSCNFNELLLRLHVLFWSVYASFYSLWDNHLEEGWMEMLQGVSDLEALQ